MEEKTIYPEEEKKFGLSSFVLKIIACVLMTMDHVGLLFFSNDSLSSTYTIYYVLRAIGKISFPIFAFLAVEGAYHSRNAFKYCLRLLVFSLLLDISGYILGTVSNISFESNPFIGNAFTDLLLGVLAITLLRKKNWWSLLAVFPIAIAYLSCITIDGWGNLFKTDWGPFSMSLFLLFFLFREGCDYYLRRKARQDGLEENVYLLDKGIRYHNYVEAIALFLTEAIFYLIYRYDNLSVLLPNEFVPIGTYSTLAFVFILLYNGKRGFDNKIVKYGFYCYYPLHLVILGIISMFCGVLASYL